MKTSSTHGQDDVAEYPDKSHTPWKGCCCRTADKYPTPWKAFHLHRGNAAAQPESSTLCKAAIAPRVKVPQVVAVYAADVFSPQNRGRSPPCYRCTAAMSHTMEGCPSRAVRMSHPRSVTYPGAERRKHRCKGSKSAMLAKRSAKLGIF